MRRSLWVAVGGIITAYRYERNFRLMVAGGTAAVAAASLSGPIDSTWWRVMTVTALILAAELGNTALERAVDLAEPRRHPVAGFAKDVAAGAVLVLALFAGVVGVLDLWPRLRLAWAADGGLVAWVIGLFTARPVEAGVATVAGLLALLGIWQFRRLGSFPYRKGG